MNELSVDRESERAATILTWLLRFGGLLTVTAFATVLLPGSTMQAIHEALGLGPLALSPVVEYMGRSLSMLYGFHGVLLFVVATDVRRHLAVVRYLGWMNLIFGATLLGIDLGAGLPSWWAFGEGPPVAVIGVIILLLARRIRPRG